MKVPALGLLVLALVPCAAPRAPAAGAVLWDLSHGVYLDYHPNAGGRFTSMAAALAANVPLPSLNVYRDRLLGAVAHGEGEKDWSVMARDQARASGIE